MEAQTAPNRQTTQQGSLLELQPARCDDPAGQCLKSNAEVEELTEKEFDPRGQYGEVIGAVKSAGDGVKIFRAGQSSTRVEYYILTVGDRKLIGVVAKAVES